MNTTRLACIRMGSASLFLPLLVLAALPLTAAAACSGKYASMQSYAGKSIYATHFLDTPLVSERLQRLPEKLHLHLKRNLDVSGPLKRVDCHLVVAGNAPHMGTEQDAMLDVDLDSGTTIAAIHGGGRIDIYVLADPAAAAPRWDALPRDVREWAARADMGFPQQPPTNLAQPSSVRLHAPPPAPANAVAKAAPAPMKIDFGVKPDAAQTAAIRRVAGDDIADCKQQDEDCYSVALADLNDDGRADLIVQYAYASGFCGSAGCSGMIVMATPHGYAGKGIGLPNFTTVAVLSTVHHGMHDLQYNGDSPIWQWTGKDYVIPKADLPQSNMQPWKTAHAAGSPLMAYVTPIDSVIKRVLVACEQGRPLLLVLTKQPLSAEPATLTFVFRGWTVNTPLQRNASNANLWMADLSRSQLPYWFAHRGFDANSRQIAPLVTESYLRINGQMEGEISLENSTAATRAALQSCYRY